MQFIALEAGVHTVDMLTLTDVETGSKVNLRSVMNVVVYDIAGDNVTTPSGISGDMRRTLSVGA